MNKGKKVKVTYKAIIYFKVTFKLVSHENTKQNINYMFYFQHKIIIGIVIHINQYIMEASINLADFTLSFFVLPISATNHTTNKFINLARLI